MISHLLSMLQCPQLLNYLNQIYARIAAHNTQVPKHHQYQNDQLSYDNRPHSAITRTEIFNRNLKLARTLGNCMKLFKKMQEEKVPPDTTTYNCLIYAYVIGKLQTPNPSACQQLFEEMQKQNIKPNATTYDYMIQAWSRHLLKCESLYREMRRDGILPDMYVTRNFLKAILVSNRSVHQKIEKCELLLKDIARLPKAHSVHILNKFIAFMFEVGIPYEEVSRKIEFFKAEGIELNTVTYTTLISHCPIDEITKYIQEMKDKKIPFPVPTFNALISRNIEQDNKDGCLQIYYAMLEQGLTPSDVTFRMLCNYFSRKQDFATVNLLVQEMKSLGYT